MRPSPTVSTGQAPAGRGPAEDRILGSSPSSEALLDAAVEYTFPASDPIAIQSAFEHARKRERRA